MKTERSGSADVSSTASFVYSPVSDTVSDHHDNHHQQSKEAKRPISSSASTMAAEYTDWLVNRGNLCYARDRALFTEYTPMQYILPNNMQVEGIGTVKLHVLKRRGTSAYRELVIEHILHIPSALFNAIPFDIDDGINYYINSEGLQISFVGDPFYFAERTEKNDDCCFRLIVRGEKKVPGPLEEALARGERVDWHLAAEERDLFNIRSLSRNARELQRLSG